MKIVAMAFLLSACTTIKDLPTKEYVIFSFNEAQKLDEYPKNQNLLVIYKTCSAKKMKREHAVEPLVRGFKEKFKGNLLGLSNSTAKIKKIIDSSIFVPNEICITLQGHPITQEPMSTSSSGEFSFEDKRHHIH